MNARDAMESVGVPWPTDTMALTLAGADFVRPVIATRRAIDAATRGGNWHRHLEYGQTDAWLTNLPGPADDA